MEKTGRRKEEKSDQKTDNSISNFVILISLPYVLNLLILLDQLVEVWNINDLQHKGAKIYVDIRSL